ncbi:MAG: lytic transglycosylase domain-containing protein, partial [Pseudomonadota bacterium]
MRLMILALLLMLTACGRAPEPVTQDTGYNPPLFPGETQDLRVLVNKLADHYAVPRSLVQRVIQREIDYR